VLDQALSDGVGQHEAHHIERKIDALGASRSARLQAVVVEALDLRQTDPADVAVLEVRLKVDIRLKPIGARGAYCDMALHLPLQRYLDLAPKPSFDESAEWDGLRLVLAVLHVERTAKNELSVDPLRQRFRNPLVSRCRANVLVSSLAAVVDNNPPTALDLPDLCSHVSTSGSSGA